MVAAAQLSDGVLRLDDVILVDIEHVMADLAMTRPQVMDRINRGVLHSVKHAGRHMVDQRQVENLRKLMDGT